MAGSVVALIVSLGVILLACHLFTNSIEWVGKRLNLGHGIVGSVLAGVGTAMPETMIPIIAILLKSDNASHDVGIGAILGAPFMLSTLAFFVTGLSVYVFSALGRRTTRMEINRKVLQRDLGFFLVSYAMVVMSGLVHVRWVHIAIGVFVLLMYVYYLRLVFADRETMNGHVEPLIFARRSAVPGFLPILIQLTLSLALIIAGAHYFVDATVCVAAGLGVSPVVLSLIITPIATELPEKANSVLWTRTSKDTLAMGNITGAMVFQSTFPVTIGLLFTAWDLDGISRVSAAIALLSGFANYALVRVRGTLNPLQLVLSGVLYLVFIGHVIGGVR